MGEDYDIQRENRHGLAVANAVIRARDERDETRAELDAANATIAAVRALCDEDERGGLVLTSSLRVVLDGYAPEAAP